MPITAARLDEVAFEINRRAAIAVPLDARQAFAAAARRETHALAGYALRSISENAELAVLEDRPMCGDTGLPRYYVKAGNEVQIEGGFAALERSLRAAVARATQQVKLRSNRVHPLTRRNPGNNVGVMAPNIDYRFEPAGDWLEITAVHKGGLFGSDYRMLFPGDGRPGIKRFVVDTIASFHRRGLSCPPAIVGVGIGGTKDQCFSLSKEAACLRLVGDRHPDPEVARLEDELLELCTRTEMGVMGLKSDTPVIDVHCEIAYTHTGALPVAVSELCTAVRRSTARIYNDGRVEYREDPEWFSAYMRREGLDLDLAGGAIAAIATRVGADLRVRPEPGAVDGEPSPLPASPPADQIREFHLTIPLTEADVRQLRAGDIVYLSGPVFTARDGVYDYMLGQGHEPPIDIRGECNVTMQSAPAGVQVTAGTEVAPGEFEVASLQATAGFRYAQWMETLCARHGVRAVVGKGGMSADVYRDVFKKYGVVCLSTLPYGVGAIFGKAVQRVRAVYWKEELGISEAMWVMEVERLGPLLVEGDTQGNSFFGQHAAELNDSLMAAYQGLPDPILRRLGEESDPRHELF